MAAKTKRRRSRPKPPPLEAPDKLPPGTPEQLERERRRLRVEQLARLRKNQYEIAEILRAEGFTTGSQPTVSRDMKCVRQEWARQRLELVDSEKDHALEVLDMLESLAVEGFLKSKAGETIEESGALLKAGQAADGTATGQDVPVVKRAKRRTKSSPGDASFLLAAVRIEELRGKWGGFEAPKKVRLDSSEALRKLAALLEMEPADLPA